MDSRKAGKLSRSFLLISMKKPHDYHEIMWFLSGLCAIALTRRGNACF